MKKFIFLTILLNFYLICSNKSNDENNGPTFNNLYSKDNYHADFDYHSELSQNNDKFFSAKDTSDDFSWKNMKYIKNIKIDKTRPHHQELIKKINLRIKEINDKQKPNNRIEDINNYLKKIVSKNKNIILVVSKLIPLIYFGSKMFFYFFPPKKKINRKKKENFKPKTYTIDHTEIKENYSIQKVFDCNLDDYFFH